MENETNEFRNINSPESGIEFVESNTIIQDVFAINDDDKIDKDANLDNQLPDQDNNHKKNDAAGDTASDVKDDDDLNIAPIVKSWKKEGLLPESFPEEDLTVDKVKEGIYDFLYKPIKDAIEEDSKGLIEVIKQENGVDDESIKIAKIYQSGDDPRFMDIVFGMNSLLNLQIEDNEDVDDEILLENRKKIIKAYKSLKGETPDEIESQLNYILDNDREEKEAKLAKAGIEKAKSEYIQKQESKINEKRNDDKVQGEKLMASYKDTIKAGDWDIPNDQFEKDVFENTHFVNIKSKDGTIIPKKVPLLGKMLYENGVRIIPIDDSKEGIKNYIKVLHDFLYKKPSGTNVKNEKLKIEDPIKDAFKNNNLAKPKPKASDTGDFNFDAIQFIDV